VIGEETKKGRESIAFRFHDLGLHSVFASSKPGFATPW
jgi:hypothetical protein